MSDFQRSAANRFVDAAWVPPVADPAVDEDADLGVEFLHGSKGAAADSPGVSMMPNEISTMFSNDALVGVKRIVTRRFRDEKSRTSTRL